MALTEMEHYLVLTDDIDGTRNFYRDALGLAVGYRPQLAFPGYWLYLGETPCIHVADRNAYAAYLAELDIPISARAQGTGPIDHIAFNGTDADDMLSRLRAAGAEVKEDEIGDIGLRQLFVHDPNGIKIELNFRGEAR